MVADEIQAFLNRSHRLFLSLHALLTELIGGQQVVVCAVRLLTGERFLVPGGDEL